MSASPTPGRPETAAVRSMFDRIAPRYDLLNRVLSAGTDVRWRAAALAYLAAPSGSVLLDLCTGTADVLATALARDASSRGTGVDLSVPMLEQGRRKLRRLGIAGRGSLVAGDVTRLPFPAGSFDRALVAFGIRNVAEPALAFAEVRRVLRPGGRLVVLEFGMPDGVLGRAYRAYFTHVLPRVGGWISGDPGAYAYLPESVARYPGADALAGLLGQAGFSRVESRRLTFGVAYLLRGDVARDGREEARS